MYTDAYSIYYGKYASMFFFLGIFLCGTEGKQKRSRRQYFLGGDFLCGTEFYST